MNDVWQAHLGETIAALAIVAGGVVVAWAAGALLRRLMHVLTHAAESALDDTLLRATRRPLALLIVLGAGQIALRTLPYLHAHQATIHQAWLAATLMVGVVAVQRVLLALLDWYVMRSVRVGYVTPTARSLPIVRRAMAVAIFVLGAVMVLDQMGISVSPLLAGLGIGGLAVALALQPLLSNVFAGSYVLSDGSIGVGDFIELRDGPIGWVEDIGWRAARIRDFDNNVIIVPNAKLADAVVTNYTAIDPGVDARVTLSVTPDADLERVEAVGLTALRAVIESHPAVVAEQPPLLQFRAFGDAGVELLAKVRARHRSEVGGLQHAMIMSLHAHFTSAGIVISTPTRHVLLDRTAPTGDARTGLPELRG